VGNDFCLKVALGMSSQDLRDVGYTVGELLGIGYVVWKH